MPETRPIDVLLRDPLSKETRSERRTLLGASAIGIVIVKTGLVPSKISALGIDFNQTDQRSLLLAIAAIIIYFLIAFLIYAGSDFLAWRVSFIDAVAGQKIHAVDVDFLLERARIEREHPKSLPLRADIIAIKMSTPMSVLRAVFEFGLPIIISIYAAILLLRAPV